jgi:PilZ domain
VFKAGTIEFSGIGVDCTIRNLSSAGAGLEVPSCFVPLPHDVTLRIVSQRSRQHCHIAWRKEKRLGVAFDNAA